MNTLILVLLGSAVACALGFNAGLGIGYGRGVQDTCSHSWKSVESGFYRRCIKCGKVIFSGHIEE